MDLYQCSKCGADLLEVGITEVTVGGISESQVTFGLNEEKEKVAISKGPDVHDFDDQWVICGSCNEELHDRTAMEIIVAYEQGNPHIFFDCEGCGTSFTVVECNACPHISGQCTGQHENNLCQECCQRSLSEMYNRSPYAAIMQEAL